MMNKVLTIEQGEFDVIQKHYTKVLSVLTNDLKTEFKSMGAQEEDLKGIEEVVRSIVMYSPRALYDFFDRNELIITIGLETSWLFEIDNGIKEVIEEGYTSRIHAEKHAFMKAFNLLEDKLNKNGDGKGEISEA